MSEWKMVLAAWVTLVLLRVLTHLLSPMRWMERETIWEILITRAVIVLTMWGVAHLWVWATGVDA